MTRHQGKLTTDQQKEGILTNRLNKSFARRIGRALSNKSKDILAEKLPAKQYTAKKQISGNHQKIFLEIGYGMGEHFVHQIISNPQNLYIGVEVYLNGVAAALKKIAEYQADNYLLWADDLDLMLEYIPENSLDGIYILFPDPWPKKRYLKKRLFNQARLAILKNKLKNHGGKLYFASDIADYFEQAKTLLINDPSFIVNNEFLTAPAGYIQTKYHKKAEQEGRIAQFLTASLNSKYQIK